MLNLKNENLVSKKSEARIKILFLGELVAISADFATDAKWQYCS